MRRFEKLTNLSLYLAQFRPKCFDGKPILVVNQGKATSRLVNRKGVQVVIARPEEHQTGDSDGYVSDLQTAIFVLEKDLSSDRTDETENEQYVRLLDIAVGIMTEIEADAAASCNEYLRGLTLASAGIVPEASIFGGWSGYSIEISFE